MVCDLVRREGAPDIRGNDSDIDVFRVQVQRGPDEWDLDTLSQVSQWRSGFHGVNGTAAVSLTRELHVGSLTKFFIYLQPE